MMNEKEQIDKINALTLEQWEPLLMLIPKIEKASKFGEWAGGKRDESGVVELPYLVPDSIVDQFLRLVYDIPVTIGFDWVSWDEGRKIARDESFDLDSTDLITKCKLITAIVRSNRFCEGALADAFGSGLILKILKSIEKEIIAKKNA